MKGSSYWCTTLWANSGSNEPNGEKAITAIIHHILMCMLLKPIVLPKVTIYYDLIMVFSYSITMRFNCITSITVVLIDRPYTYISICFRDQ